MAAEEGKMIVRMTLIRKGMEVFRRSKKICFSLPTYAFEEFCQLKCSNTSNETFIQSLEYFALADKRRAKRRVNLVNEGCQTGPKLDV